MSITIKDVARAANVSYSTVSRALKNSPKISAKTKEKIRRIAKELNYIPNAVARELSSQKTTTVGFIYNIGTHKSNLDPIMEGIEETVAKEGFQLLSFNSRENLKTEHNYLRFLHEKRAEGILIFPVITEEGSNLSYLKSLIKGNIPVVVIDRYFPELDTDYVVSDNFGGAYEATAHLIKLGHRRIGYITGQEYQTSVYDRLEGYKKALEDHRIIYQKELIKKVAPKLPSSIEEGWRATKDLLKERPTAIFTYNEIATVGALKAIREEGINVPEDLAFIGFDEVAVASHIFMPLTVVVQQAYKIGEMGARMIIERVKHLHQKKDCLETRHISVRTKLLVRDSCGAKLKGRVKVNLEGDLDGFNS
ncbi:LacI family transcriptional regulator [Candidatus Aerophobetes bacterium]|uniref:LacI family transcriptional regulator n=2 Tax=root TaxID=1 RepID=A0A523YS97_UNCAE|nr:MAG: LacI family transcriptional regulator [Candidatus Aerophobetes bacterium]